MDVSPLLCWLIYLINAMRLIQLHYLPSLWVIKHSLVVHRCVACISIETYKIVHSLDCIKFDNYFAFKGRALRHHPKSLTIPSSRINVYRHSYFVNAPFIWNQLPLEIIQSPSLSVLFKLRIKSMFSSIYNTITPSSSATLIPHLCIYVCCVLQGSTYIGRLPFVQPFPYRDKIISNSNSNSLPYPLQLNGVGKMRIEQDAMLPI